MSIQFHPFAGISPAIDLALLHAGYETGWWDDDGRPAPWPDDINEWRPSTNERVTLQPGESPF